MFTAHIDYLTLTRVYDKNPVNSAVMSHWGAESVASDIVSSLVGTCGGLKKALPQRFYRYTFEDKLSGAIVALGEDVTQQGVKVTFSGSALQRLHDPDFTLKLALQDGWKVTRLDLAIDAIDEGHTVKEYGDVFESLHGHNQQRTWSRLRSPTGETLYIGSRQSARMLRVYDKGKEQKTDSDWLRFEIEYKDYASMPASSAWLADRAFIYREVLDMLAQSSTSLIAGLEEMAHGYIHDRISKPKTSSKRVLWFQTQVMSAFEKIVLEDPLEAIECLASIEETLLKQYEKWMGNPSL